jgi:hypothetical protein
MKYARFLSPNFAHSRLLPFGSRLVINTCIPLRFMLGGTSRNFV